MWVSVGLLRLQVMEVRLVSGLSLSLRVGNSNANFNISNGIHTTNGAGVGWGGGVRA